MVRRKDLAHFQADTWTALPINDLVIEKLNQLADADDIAMGKTPKQRKGFGKKVLVELHMVVDDLSNDPLPIESIIELPTQHVLPITDDDGPFINNESNDSDKNNPVVVTEMHDDDGLTTESSVVAPQQMPTRIVYPLGTRLVQGLRKSNRIAGRYNVQVTRIAVNKAIAKYDDVANKAITKELQQIIDKKA